MVERGLDRAGEDEEPETAMTEKKDSDSIKNHKRKQERRSQEK